MMIFPSEGYYKRVITTIADAHHAYMRTMKDKVVSQSSIGNR